MAWAISKRFFSIEIFDCCEQSIKPLTSIHRFMSPVSPVFHAVVTVSSGLKNMFRVETSIQKYQMSILNGRVLKTFFSFSSYASQIKISRSCLTSLENSSVQSKGNNNATTTTITITTPYTSINPLKPLANTNNHMTSLINHHQQQHLTNAPDQSSDHYITLTLHKYDTAAIL